ENLSNSYFYEIPAVGHSVTTSSPCAQTIAADFINDPTTAPDSACIAGIPALTFEVEGDETATEEAVSITLVPFPSADGRYRSVVAEGWREAAPGVYARG